MVGRGAPMSSAPQSLPIIHIFIASPGDTAEERALAQDIIENDLAKRATIEPHVVLRAIRWDDPDRHIPMLANAAPQQSVIDNLPRPALCQITVVLLWARMGTPLKGGFEKPDGTPYLSGTEWEALDALGASPRPDVLVFRRRGQPPMADSDEGVAEQMRQRGMVNALEMSLRQHGSLNAHDGPGDLRAKLTGQLEKLIARRIEASKSKHELDDAARGYVPAPPLPPPPLSWTAFGAMKGEKGKHGEAYRIEANPSHRGEVAARLMSLELGERYRQMLDGLLATAEKIWGERGSARAFLTCTFFSLIYAYVLFWLETAIGGGSQISSIANTQLLREPSFGKLLLVVLLVGTAIVVLLPTGRLIARAETHLQDHTSRVSGVFFSLIVVMLFGMFFWLGQPGWGQSVALGGFIAMWVTAGPIFGVFTGDHKENVRSAFFASLTITIVATGTAIVAVGIGATESMAVVAAGAFGGVISGVASRLLPAAAALGGAIAGGVLGTGAIAVAGCIVGVSLYAHSSIGPNRIYAATVGCVAGLGIAFMFHQPVNQSFGAYLAIAFVLLPFANGALDFLSWRVSRWLGEFLQKDLAAAISPLARLRNVGLHIAADVVLAVVFFLAMAATLGFAFEAYDIYDTRNDFGLHVVADKGAATGYVHDVFAAPFTTGLWITLMLATTLVPTLIHFAAAIGAVLPAVLLPDQGRRALALRLDALPATPPDDEAGREVWRDTIWRAAKLSLFHRWRFLAGLGVTAILLGLAILSGLHLPFEHWARDWAIEGIEFARRLFG